MRAPRRRPPGGTSACARPLRPALRDRQHAKDKAADREPRGKFRRADAEHEQRAVRSGQENPRREEDQEERGRKQEACHSQGTEDAEGTV